MILGVGYPQEVLSLSFMGVTLRRPVNGGHRIFRSGDGRWNWDRQLPTRTAGTPERRKGMILIGSMSRHVLALEHCCWPISEYIYIFERRMDATTRQ